VAEGVEIRVRLSNKRGEASRKFHDWSTSVTIPSKTNVDCFKKPGISHKVGIEQMTVLDDAKKKLELWASL
jgi:hypothetical protein